MSIDNDGIRRIYQTHVGEVSQQAPATTELHSLTINHLKGGMGVSNASSVRNATNANEAMMQAIALYKGSEIFNR